MEPPTSIAFSHEPEWVCKEPALVTWNDNNCLDLSSIGLPCPTGKPTQITLWVGKHPTSGLCIVLQLRITARFSKRRRVLDYYLPLPPPTGSVSVTKVDDASQNVKECLEDAYGKSSTKKCIRVSFQPSGLGRVLMPSVPSNAPCFEGTPFHLLTQFRSLSHASQLDVYIAYSSYAQHALMSLETPLKNLLACTEYIDLPRSYGGNGGVFDDWRQLGDKSPNPFSDAQQPCLDPGQKDQEHNQPGVGTSPRVKTHRPLSAKAYEALEHGPPADVQEMYSPPPYSPARQSVRTSVTPESQRVPKLQSELSGCLKRSRDSNSPGDDKPRAKSAKLDLIESFPSTIIDTSNVVHNKHSPQAQRVCFYSPTVANTPSTVEESQLFPLEHTTPTRHEYHSTNVSPVQSLASSRYFASHRRTRPSAAIEEPDSAHGHPLNFNRGSPPPLNTTDSSSPETPRIKPTVFTRRLEFLSVPVDAEDIVSQLEHEQPPEKNTGSFVPTQRSLDHVSPTRTDHPLNAAQLPPLTTQALQRLMDDLLESVDYSYKVAELGLQETSDEFKVELQLEKDKGVEEITEHAEEILAGVKGQMDDLASGHLVSFEDMLQKTNGQLQQIFKAFLGGLVKAMAMGKGCLDRRAAEDTRVDAPLVRHQRPAFENLQPMSMPDSSPIVATKLFLQEFGELRAAAKVKVLERLTSQSTAEIFLTVDRELRGAWVASWTGEITS
ncbi:hypothetical protein D6D01_00635 [Aureobasidium pullulans]|uniref:Uncharacterized protein n=1 Tax=Aureobasidium pullulans TaxID=5580 RepID=A0A4S9M2N3_AURPU|nr:hypothetical protein D6D01_00635 [Aureobasidium pullulans]